MKTNPTKLINHGCGSVLALLFLLLAMVLPADATLTIRLSSNAGATWTTVADGDPADASAMAGVVTFIGAVGPWSINVTTGISKPVTGSPSAPYLDLTTSSFLSSAPGTLIIQLSDNDFAPAGLGFLAAIGGTTDGTVTYKTWADAGNVLFAKTTLLTSQGPFGGGAFNQDMASAASSGGAPYSLTLQTTIKHAAAGTSTGFDAVLTAVERGDTCGKSHGFWKNHPEAWPAGYSPSQTVVSVFANASLYPDAASRTLQEALEGKAGSKNAVKNLLTQAVGALLNAASPDLNYAFTVNEVVTSVNAALAAGNGSMKNLQQLLDEANNDEDCGGG